MSEPVASAPGISGRTAWVRGLETPLRSFLRTESGSAAVLQMGHRRRVLDVATSLLYTDRVSVDGLLKRTFPFDHAAEAYAWLDQNPQAAVKVALDYGSSARPIYRD